jgi:hypothetical protein
MARTLRYVLTPVGRPFSAPISLRQRVSSVQGFEEIAQAAINENLSEDQQLRNKKMQKIGYKGNDAIEADEVSCSAGGYSVWYMAAARSLRRPQLTCLGPQFRTLCSWHTST